MAEQMTGGCACGRVRYRANVEDDDAYLCHCRMCQRSTGSVSIAFKSIKQANIQWEHEPDWYDSSPIAQRPYCSECGTSLGFRFREGSRDMDLTVASFDEPSRFRPRHHSGAESMHRGWIDTHRLPEKRTQDYPTVVDRWIKVTGEFPG